MYIRLHFNSSSGGSSTEAVPQRMEGGWKCLHLCRIQELLFTGANELFLLMEKTSESVTMWHSLFTLSAELRSSEMFAAAAGDTDSVCSCNFFQNYSLFFFKKKAIKTLPL